MSSARIAALDQPGAAPRGHYARKASAMSLADAIAGCANPAADRGAPIALVKPPIVFSRNAYSTPLTQPIGLAYLGAVLERAGYAVQIVDCPGAAPERIALSADGRFRIQGLDVDSALDRIDPRSDVIGVTIMFSQEWPFVRDFIAKVRERFPDAAIVAGGEHVTALREFSLRDCPAIDFAVSGEGELAMLRLVHRLRSGAEPVDIPGVAAAERKRELARSQRSAYERVAHAPDGALAAPREDGPASAPSPAAAPDAPAALAPRMAELDALPWPAWHLIDVRAYFRPNFTMGISRGRNMALVATRGCPYQCTFCSNPTMWTTRYVMRSAVDVVDEIEHNVRVHGCNSVDFYDLTAIVKRDWILAFTDELERRKLDVVWQLPSGTRSESIDAEVVERLARTGCAFLVYAPESGSRRTLQRIQKRVDLDAMQASIRAAVRAGLVVKTNFILGFPDETRSEMLQTLWMVWKLAWMKVDDCNISSFAPYPGSRIYQELVESGELEPPSDAYFQNLITQFDFTVQKTVCRHASSLEILLYRVAGMSIFYALSYLRAPSRIARLLRMLFAQTPPAPRSLFEQRIYDVLARRRVSRREAA